MKECKEQDHFSKTDDRDQCKQGEKITEKEQPVAAAKAKSLRPPAGERRSEQQYAVYQQMNGQIEREYDERARQPVDGEEDDEASAERARAVKQDDGREDDRRGVDTAQQDEREQERVPRRPLEEDDDDAALGKTNAVEKFFGDTQMIIVARRRFYKHGAEDHADQKTCRERREQFFAFQGAGKYIPHAKKRVHILSYEPVCIYHSNL